NRTAHDRSQRGESEGMARQGCPALRYGAPSVRRKGHHRGPMSAFDDEFGLFSDEQEAERRSTLGGRRIVSNETIIDDVEPEDEGPPRRRSSAGSGAQVYRRP